MERKMRLAVPPVAAIILVTSLEISARAASTFWTFVPAQRRKRAALSPKRCHRYPSLTLQDDRRLAWREAESKTEIPLDIL